MRMLVLVAALLLGACSGLQTKLAEPTTQAGAADPDSVFVGYALMYEFVSTQKNSDKLLLIKRESDDVNRMVKEISQWAGEVDGQLKRFAKAEPRIKLDDNQLPLLEKKQRESARAERTKEFLGTSGKEFERLILLTQSGSLTTERHIARALRESEQDPERKAYWEMATRRFDEVYARLKKLLEQQYFS